MTSNSLDRNRISKKLTIGWAVSMAVAFAMDYPGGVFFEAASTILFWLAFSIACFLPLLEIYKSIKVRQLRFSCIALSTLPLIATLGLMVVVIALSGIGSHRL